MRTLKECKEIMKASKESLDSFEASFGDLSLSYGSSYADYMLSSTNSDVFIRIKEKEGEDTVYIVCDSEASESRKEAVSELINNQESLDNLINCETEVNATDAETEIKTFGIKGKGGEEVSSIIVDLISKVWPYVLGYKVIGEATVADDLIEKVEEENAEEIIEKDDKEQVFEEENKLRGITEKLGTVAAEEEVTKDDVFADAPIEEEEITQEKDLSEEAETPFIEKKETEDNETDKPEEEHVPRKPYITENVPERNGKTRLITKTIGDSAYQLFFLLPDEEEHYVDIECEDSSGLIDSRSIKAQDQFRYLIFPYSPEPKVLVSIRVDGEKAYENVFKMPNHLRLKRKPENTKPEIDPEYIVQNDNTIAEDTEPAETLDLDLVVFSMTQISNEAVKFLKGERHV